VWRRSLIDRVDEEPEVVGEVDIEAIPDRDDGDDRIGPPGAADGDRQSAVRAGWGGNARVPTPPTRPPSPSPSPSPVPPPTGTPSPTPSPLPTATPTPFGATPAPTRSPSPTITPYTGYVPATPPPPGAVNVTHLSLMTYKLVLSLQPSVRSVLDLPCDATAEWMPSVLARLAYEVPAFAYTCVWAGADSRDAAAHKAALVNTTAAVRFLHRPSVGSVGVGGEGVPPADLALCWGGFGGWSLRAVWRYFRALGAAHVRFVAFQNTLSSEPGGAPNTPGSPINVRRPPFHFGAAARIFNGMDVPAVGPPTPAPSPTPAAAGERASPLPSPSAAPPGPPRKQLLLYEVAKLRGDTYFRKMRRYRRVRPAGGEAAVEAEAEAEAERQRFRIYG